MKRIRRRWWTAAVSLTATLVVLGALTSALFQLAVLALPGYREELSSYITRAVGRPVDIGGVHLIWRGLTPRLELSGIALYPEHAEDQDAALSVDRVEMGFSLQRMLRGDFMPSRLELAGLRLSALIDQDGRLQLRGFDSSGASTVAREDWARHLDRFRHIGIEDCEMELVDQRLDDTTLQFRVLRADAQRRLGGVDLSARLLPPNGAGAVAEVEVWLDGEPSRPLELDGEWQARIVGFSGAPWLGPGTPQGLGLAVKDANFRMDGEIRNARLGPMRASLSVAAVAAVWQGREARSEALALHATAEPVAGGFRVNITHLGVDGRRGAWPDSGGQLLAVRDQGQWSLDATLDLLRLDDLAPWAALALPKAPALLGGLGGDLRAISLQYRDGEAGAHWQLAAGAEGLQLVDDRLRLTGLSGQLTASEQSGRFVLVGEAPRVELPAAFAAPLALSAASGNLAWQHGAQGLALDLSDLTLAMGEARAEGQAHLDFPAGGEARMQLQLAFSAPDVLPYKAYIPRQWARGIGPWLMRAIEQGRLVAGRLEIDGPLKGIPYPDAQGRFELDLDVDNGRLAFLGDWPALERLAGRVSLRNNGLTVTARDARIAGGQVTRAEVRVVDFRTALLEIQGEVIGDTAGFYTFLEQTPLRPRLAALLDRTRARGPAQVQLQIAAPLRERRAPDVAGSVVLQSVELAVTGLHAPIQGLNGTIAFNGDGRITAESLSGQLDDTALSGRIDPAGQGAGLLRAQGRFEANAGGEGLSRYLPSWLRRNMDGATEVHAELALGVPDAALTLRSELRGVAVNLPAPFSKPAQVAQAFELNLFSTPQDPLRLTLQLPGQLAGELRFSAAGELQRGQLRLGGGVPDTLPERGLRVDGQVANADPLAWIAVFQTPDGDMEVGATLSNGPAPASHALPAGDLRSLELAVQQMELAGFRFAPLSLSMVPHGGGIELALRGEGAEGSASWDAQRHHFSFNGSRVKLTGGPVRSAIPAPDSPPTADAALPAAVRDPGTWPTLALNTAALQLADVQLGQVRLSADRVPGGLALQQLKAQGAELDLDAHGRWQRNAGLSSAQLEFFVSSPAFDRLMVGMGYAPTLRARSAAVGGSLTWRPAGQGLDWREVDGFVEVAADKGSVIAVEPGAGRVLGLLNFYALPRRLTLDFRDVTGSGLGFDQIDGGFDIASGIAHTDNLDIDGPSLRVTMRGDVDLAARRYDQRVTIYPDVSGGVTLGALLLGGPAAGLIALIAQQVLDRPLDQATQLSYRLTGPWENPQIERAGGG